MSYRKLFYAANVLLLVVFVWALLKDNNADLRKSSALVSDTESKLKAQREGRDVDSDKTYATMVKLLGLCQVVYGTRSIEYKRARAEFDELRPKRRRSSGTSTGPIAPAG